MLKLLICLLAIHFAASQTCTYPYTVKSGDTCWSIWTNNRLTDAQFYAANPTIDCGALKVGQVVCLGSWVAVSTSTAAPTVQLFSYPFSSCTSAHVVKSGDYCYSIMQQYGLSLQQFMNLNPYIDCNTLQVGSLVCVALVVSTTPAPTTTTVYRPVCLNSFTVMAGDSCDLYVRFKMVADYATLYANNPGLDCNNLQAGQVICTQTAGNTLATLLTSVPTVASTVAPIVVSTVAPIVVSTVAPTWASTAPITCTRYHTVAAGDTCWAIANRYQVTEQSLYTYNYNLNCAGLQVGQVICLDNGWNYQTTVAPTWASTWVSTAAPITCTRYHTVASGDTCWAIANRYQVTEQSLYTYNYNLNCAGLQVGQVVCLDNGWNYQTSTSSWFNDGCTRAYTVKSGDSCWAIANAYGITTNDLLNMNPSLNCAALTVGQVIAVGRYC